MKTAVNIRFVVSMNLSKDLDEPSKVKAICNMFNTMTMMIKPSNYDDVTKL